MMFKILRSTLIEFGVDVKNFKVDETGKVTFEIDFSEHDKKVTEEKIERLESAYHRHKSRICNLESENQSLKRKIEDLETVIAGGKKQDISVSENGVSVGCECGGYHLAKERIKVLEKENSELDHMRKSWMETAEKWSKLNKDLQDRIDSLEFAINQVAELEDRHQSDCIEINRLHTALEVMTEKYMKLREVHGL